MNKIARNLQKQARKRGQSVVFISSEELTRCPCWNETYQQADSYWHDANSEAPMCNEDGYLLTDDVRTEGAAFVLPYEAMSRSELKVFSHHIERLGPVQNNDHLLLAPSLPEGTKFIEWAQRKWHVYNHIPVYVGDEVAMWLALVRGT